jgi:hypothetical protein
MLNIEKIHEAIDAWILTNPTESYHVHIEKDSRQRPYLGLSGIGEPCERKIWYQFRHALVPEFPARIHRLFRRGDREEFVFMWILQGIGVQVFERDSDGKQFSVKDVEGHVKGNLDGVGIFPDQFGFTDPVLLEFKTASEKKFNEFVKLGVKKANSKYFGQLQSYMGRMDLKAAAFFVVNKNTDDLYIEFVPFDKFAFRQLASKAEDIVNSQEPPPKLSNIASDFRCKFCEFHGICHKKQSAQRICRTCKFASPGPDASWVCDKNHIYGEVCADYKDITK